MRRIPGAVIVISALAFSLLASAQQPPQISPKLKGVVESMKAYAGSKPGLVSRIPQGTFYFKWIQSPPAEFEKAYFKLGELNKGTKFLSLNLIRRTPAGVELVVLNDIDMNSNIEEAYRATGRTLQDADRAIAMSSEKLKIPVTPAFIDYWNAMIDELKWELKAKD
jgi:hypothetical protein